jgi:hypothetical protein
VSDTENKETTNAETAAADAPAETKSAPKKKSRDRNQRVRELAARKIEESKKNANARAPATGLDAGEMFDDALARGFAGFTKWIKANRRSIEIGAVVALLGVAGFVTWDWYSTRRLGKASTALFQAVRSEAGIVKTENAEEPQPDDDEARFDTRARFPTHEARRDAALGAYRAVAGDYSSLGAGMLAKLGEAGVLLSKRDYDGALTAANAVLSSELAKADIDVRMSAKELAGMALEGKGDLDGAKAAFEEMAGGDPAHYKALGEYHAARVLLAKGDKDGAKDRLLKLRDKLTTSASESNPPSEYLSEQVELLLRQIDPALAPARGGSGSQLTPEQIMRLQQEFQRLGGGAGNPMLPVPAPAGSTP